ncbi:MAG: PQQ-binding-like beta-propeller repeat protein [Thermoplasmata archaeon]
MKNIKIERNRIDLIATLVILFLMVSPFLLQNNNNNHSIRNISPLAVKNPYPQNSNWMQWMYNSTHNDSELGAAPMVPFLKWSVTLNNSSSNVNYFPYNPSPLVYNNLVYMESPGLHYLYAFHISNGALAWKKNSTAPGIALSNSYYFNVTPGIGNNTIMVPASNYSSPSTYQGYVYFFNATNGNPVNLNPSATPFKNSSGSDSRYYVNATYANNKAYISSPPLILNTTSGTYAITTQMAKGYSSSPNPSIAFTDLSNGSTNFILNNASSPTFTSVGPDLGGLLGVPAVNSGGYYVYGFFNGKDSNTVNGGSSYPRDQIIGLYFNPPSPLSDRIGYQLGYSRTFTWTSGGLISSTETTTLTPSFYSYTSPLNYGNGRSILFFYTEKITNVTTSSLAGPSGTKTKTFTNVSAMKVTGGSTFLKISPPLINTTLSSASYINSTPVIYNGYVYVPIANHIYKMSYNELNSSGKNVTEGTFNSTGNITSSLIIANGILYFTTDKGMVYALNTTYLSNSSVHTPVLWSYRTSGPIYSTPAISNGNLIVYSNNILYCFSIPQIEGNATPNSLYSHYIAHAGVPVPLNVNVWWNNVSSNKHEPIGNAMINTTSMSGGYFITGGNTSYSINYTSNSGNAWVYWVPPVSRIWINATLKFSLSSGKNQSYFNPNTVYTVITVAPASNISFKATISQKTIYLGTFTESNISMLVFNQSSGKPIPFFYGEWTVNGNGIVINQTSGVSITNRTYLYTNVHGYSNITFKFKGTISKPTDVYLVFNATSPSYIQNSTLISILIVPGNASMTIVDQYTTINLNNGINKDMINVTVYNSSNKPISGASISAKLSNPSIGYLSYYASTTNSNGVATFIFYSYWVNTISNETIGFTFSASNYTTTQNNTNIIIIPTNLNATAVLNTTWVSPGGNAKGEVYIYNKSSNQLYNSNVSVGFYTHTWYATISSKGYTSNGTLQFKINTLSNVTNAIEVNITFTISNNGIIKTTNATHLYIIPSNVMGKYGFFNYTVKVSPNPVYYSQTTFANITVKAIDGINSTVVKGASVYVSLTNGTIAEIYSFSKNTGTNSIVLTTNNSGEATFTIKGNYSFYNSIIEWAFINISKSNFANVSFYSGIKLIGNQLNMNVSNTAIYASQGVAYINGTISNNNGMKVQVIAQPIGYFAGVLNTTVENSNHTYSFKLTLPHVIYNNTLDKVKITAKGYGFNTTTVIGYVNILVSSLSINASGLPGIIYLNKTNKQSFTVNVYTSSNTKTSANIFIQLTNTTYGWLTNSSNNYIFTANTTNVPVVEGVIITASENGYGNSTVFETITIMPSKITVYPMSMSMISNKQIESSANLSPITITINVYNQSNNAPINGALISLYLSNPSIAALSSTNGMSSNGIYTVNLTFNKNASSNQVETIFATATYNGFIPSFNSTSIYIQFAQLKQFNLSINASTGMHYNSKESIYINATYNNTFLTNAYLSLTLSNKTIGYLSATYIYPYNGTARVTFVSNSSSQMVVELITIKVSKAGFYTMNRVLPIYIYNSSSSSLPKNIGITSTWESSTLYSLSTSKLVVYIYNTLTNTPISNATVRIQYTPTNIISLPNNNYTVRTNQYGYANISFQFAKVINPSTVSINIYVSKNGYNSTMVTNKIIIYPQSASSSLTNTGTNTSIYTIPILIIIILVILIALISGLYYKQKTKKSKEETDEKSNKDKDQQIQTEKDDTRLHLKPQIIREETPTPTTNIAASSLQTVSESTVIEPGKNIENAPTTSDKTTGEAQTISPIQNGNETNIGATQLPSHEGSNAPQIQSANLATNNDTDIVTKVSESTEEPKASESTEEPKVSESTEEPKSESTDGKEITPLLDSTNMPVNNEQKENVESQKSEDQKPPTDFNEELNVNDENIKTMTIDQLKKELIEANKELNISDEQKSIDEIEALHSNSFTDDNSFKDDLEKKLMEVKELQKNKKQRKKQQGD